jgi:hypothetical protein
MSERGNDSNRGRMLAQDGKIVARSDSYGPMDGQQVKIRPPPPAPMVKAQSAAQPVTNKKSVSE